MRRYLPWLIGVVVLFVLFWFLFTALLRNDPVKAPQAVQEEITEVGAISQDPQVFEGENVIVKGRVIGWVAKNAFSLGSSGYSSPGDVLVISSESFHVSNEAPQGELALGDDNEEVLVVGVVQIYNASEDASGLDLDTPQQELNTWENRAVIYAERIEKL